MSATPSYIAHSTLVEGGKPIPLPNRDPRLGPIYCIEFHPLLNQLPNPSIISEILIVLVDTNPETAGDHWEWEKDQRIPLGSIDSLKKIGALV